MDDKSLEGWAPAIPDDATLVDVVDRAFDYRGDVTIVLRDGSERVGYLSNRQAEIADPFVELLEPASADPVTVRYADIRAIRFSGRDPAAGNSYAAWLERKAAAKAAGHPVPQR